MNGPIVPANTRTISQSGGGLPQMDGTLQGWMRPITVGIVTKIQENFQIKEVVRNFVSSGVIQPLGPKQLAIKPEGQRGWTWAMLHCVTSLRMNTDDAPTINGVRYRVMELNDYSAYGYLEYHLVQDYRPANVPPKEPVL